MNKKTKKLLKILSIVFAILGILFLILLYVNSILKYHSIILDATSIDDRETVKYIIDEKGVNPNKIFFRLNLLKHYILMHTKDSKKANKADPKFIQFLIDNGAKIDMPNDKAPSIMLAIFFSEPYVLEKLIENGANLNLKNLANATPLGVAIQFERCQMIEILLDNGASLEGDIYKDAREKQLKTICKDN